MLPEWKERLNSLRLESLEELFGVKKPVIGMVHLLPLPGAPGYTGYGMDLISLSNTIGLAFTLFERGIITEADTGGLQLTWGNTAVVEQLVEQTARRPVRVSMAALLLQAIGSYESNLLKLLMRETLTPLPGF